jgi:hypothetical protein
MGGLSAIAGRSACLVGSHGLAGLIFDVQAILVVVVELARIRITLLTPGGSFGRQGAHIQPLAKQVNALQQREALDQPADSVVDGKPGFVGRWMAVTAPPTTDCFLEGWGKTTFSASAAVGPRIRRHARILIRIGERLHRGRQSR